MQHRLSRWLYFSFTGSFAVICIERAIYFLTADRLGFNDWWNLWLALIFGITYVAGASVSHFMAGRWGEKRVLIGLLGMQLLVHSGLALGLNTASVYFLGCASAGLLYGAFWPIVESYIGAGRTTAASQRAIGMFNLAWAAAIPLTMIVAGPLIRHWPTGLFVIPAVLNLLMLWWLRAAPDSPPRFRTGHPELMPPEETARLVRLLSAHRWLLLSSYVTMFILAPLLPSVFARLGVSVGLATAWSGMLDLVRLATFLVMWRFTAWHGSTWLVKFAIVALPVGFFLALFGGTLPLVILGECLFGAAMGGVYYGALHYALLVSNAAVNASGAHESIIGTGFAVGPLIGLVSLALAPFLGGEMPAIMLILGPLFLLSSVLALRQLPSSTAAGTPK